jgi:glycerol-3-phosphate dehydrogenase (NAD(P)+)
VTHMGQDRGIDLPVCGIVAALTRREISVEIALQSLLSRPLKKE